MFSNIKNKSNYYIIVSFILLMFSCFYYCFSSNVIEEIVYYPKDKKSRKDKNEKKKNKEEKVIFMKAYRDKKSRLLDGFLEIYNKDGSMKEKILYIQGKPQYNLYNFDSETRLATIYFKNSDKVHCKYSMNIENQLDGEYLLYNHLGKLIEKRNYKNGILYGEHFRYQIYDSDDLSTEGENNNIKKKVYIVKYDDFGKVISANFQ